MVRRARNRLHDPASGLPHFAFDRKERVVKIAVSLEPSSGSPPDVAYRWDPDTDILSAQLSRHDGTSGLSAPLGLEGADGSWLILDVAAGRITGVEVAVWPDVRQLASLAPPPAVEDAHVVLPSRVSQANTVSLETATRLVAEADAAQRTFHFRFGSARGTRTVRLGRDLLLDVDDKSHMSGLWLLNVPPCPADL
jgi:hypothetical protein